MEKVLNFKISKLLTESNLLDFFNPKYFYVNQYERLTENNKDLSFLNNHKVSLSKTLTLEEVISFINEKVNQEGINYIEEEISKESWGTFSVLIIADLPFFEKILETLLNNNKQYFK